MAVMARMKLSNTNRPIECFRLWRDDECGLLMDAPYQRGDVWGTKRRVNLIRSVLLEVPIPSIIINDRGSADWSDDYRVAVIDGRQRITTLLRFIDGQLRVPGAWFGVDSETVSYSDLSISEQRRFRQTPVAVSEGRLATLEEEQEVFDLVNFGGLAQGERDDK